MSETFMLIVGGRPSRRRPGRPRATEPKTSVCAWVAASEHDKLIQLAKDQDMSVSAFVRTVILKEVRRR